MLKARTSARTGVKSLYLEMNRDGRRTYEFLHLYLNPGRENAAMNKVTMEAAKTIQAKRIVEIQRGEAEILSPARLRGLLPQQILKRPAQLAHGMQGRDLQHLDLHI